MNKRNIRRTKRHTKGNKTRTKKGGRWSFHRATSSNKKRLEYLESSERKEKDHTKFDTCQAKAEAKCKEPPTSMFQYNPVPRRWNTGEKDACIKQYGCEQTRQELLVERDLEIDKLYRKLKKPRENPNSSSSFSAVRSP